MSDVGEVMVKHVDNPLGPPALLCELIGTRLAAWLGLRTFEAFVVPFPRALLVDGARPQDEPPAFVTLFTAGRPWSGTANDLERAGNREDVAGFVLFDTWTRNRDRYWAGRGDVRKNLGNVFLADDGPTLMAIDHTECFKSMRSLGPWVGHIESVRDSDIFGLFPGFGPHMRRAALQTYVDRLGAFGRTELDAILSEVPAAWWNSSALRPALESAILERGRFVCEHLRGWLDDQHAWHTLL